MPQVYTRKGEKIPYSDLWIPHSRDLFNFSLIHRQRQTESSYEKLSGRPTRPLRCRFHCSNLRLRIVKRLVNHLKLPASALLWKTVVTEATSTVSDMYPGPQLCMIAYRIGRNARLDRLEHLAGKCKDAASL